VQSVRTQLKEFFQARSTLLGVLLTVIAVSLLSSTMLAQRDQIFLLKVFLVLFLSLVPGWLYLQFIVSKGEGLYDEYVLNLYRLKIDNIAHLPKPPPASYYWDEWIGTYRGDDPGDNIYLKKFEATYGHNAVPEPRRLKEESTEGEQARNDGAEGRRRPQRTKIVELVRHEAFSPVMLATAVLCVGWTVVVQPELLRNWHPLGNGTLSGLPKDLPTEALRYGFVGSYTFILQGLVRRYFQADLKTKAYVSAMARITLVSALVVALDGTGLLQGPSAKVTAFLLGMFPELGLRLAWRTLRTAPAKLTGKDDNPLTERYPLRDLDGINLWTEARLLEEGIENMQNLATANLVNLMLHTRRPVNCLVDWIDQAFLYLRVKDKPARDRLRRIGIRTATDLERAFAIHDHQDQEFVKGLRRVANADKDGKKDGLPSATFGLLHALKDEVNLVHVRAFKQHAWLDEPDTGWGRSLTSNRRMALRYGVAVVDIHVDDDKNGSRREPKVSVTTTG
jgi:hypothetical protein